MHRDEGLFSARSSATHIVQQCVQSGLSLGQLLPLYLEQTKVEHRALAQEISFGVLRWFYRLQTLLDNMLSKPLRGKKQLINHLLLVGLYQLIYLDKVNYAVVKETVNACDELQQSWAKGLVNAILRRFLREQESLLKPLDASYSSRFAYPEWMIKALKTSWQGLCPIEPILAAGNQRPPMTLRINQTKSLSDYQQRLKENDIAFSVAACGAFNQHALILNKPLAVEKLPLFNQGALSVQDAAAQLAAQLLAPAAGDYILDACAAPGGKTMHLFEQQPQLKQIIALDISEQRLQRIEENRQRLQVPAEKITLMAADASKQDWWSGELFDCILLDAPCSATGVIRRHPDIKVLRREDDIQQLVKLQAQILNNLWPLLKPGGLLLYATCSILRVENDLQISAFLQADKQAEEVIINAEWGQSMPVGRQIFPGEQNMDGFFYALLRKNSSL